MDWEMGIKLLIPNSNSAFRSCYNLNQQQLMGFFLPYHMKSCEIN